MLVVLFGLAGAGKTYVGKFLGEKSNFYFWDAGEALTDEMKERICEKRSFTQAMRDRYFTIVIERMKLLCAEHEHVVVSQAFYKNKNREQVLSTFPDCLFIQVSIEFKILLKRLRERNNSVDEDYANKISINFETPTHHYYSIHNNMENNDTSLITQFMSIHTLNSILTINTNTTSNININNEPTIKYRARFHRLFFVLQDIELNNDLSTFTVTEQQNYTGLKNTSGTETFRFFSGEKSYQTEVFLDQSIAKVQSISLKTYAT